MNALMQPNIYAYAGPRSRALAATAEQGALVRVIRVMLPEKGAPQVFVPGRAASL